MTSLEKIEMLINFVKEIAKRSNWTINEEYGPYGSYGEFVWNGYRRDPMEEAEWLLEKIEKEIDA